MIKLITQTWDRAYNWSAT